VEPSAASAGYDRPGVCLRRQSILPAVAVSNAGVVGVSWYAAAPDHRNGFALRFCASVARDDLRVLNVIEEQGGPLQTTVRRQSGWPGDTQGLAADAAGVFHTFWYDNRTGVMQLWSASVTIDQPAYRNGTAELAAFEDVTPDIALDYGTLRYEASTHTITLDAVLRNKSSRVIVGPLKARVVELSSPKGALEVVGASNGDRGPGSVWDWTSALADGKLNPSQASAPVKLIFRMKDANLAALDYGDVQFSIRLLAHHVAGTKQ